MNNIFQNNLREETEGFTYQEGMKTVKMSPYEVSR